MRLKLPQIPVVVTEGTETECRLLEIAENLHRGEVDFLTQDGARPRERGHPNLDFPVVFHLPIVHMHNVLDSLPGRMSLFELQANGDAADPARACIRLHGVHVIGDLIDQSDSAHPNAY